MRRGTFLLVLLLLGSGLVSCGYSSTKSTVVPAVRCTDRCASDSSNSYEVFVPERTHADQKFPLLLILDPHGSGKSALNHFLLAAERYPMVLVASNRVQNNLPDYESVIRTLSADIEKKYPVSKIVYLCGFSGGARMAVGYALNHPVNGLVLSGALAAPQELKRLGCLVYAISGTDDFNFMETAQFVFQEANIPSNLCLEITRSSHSWPDNATLANALGFVRTAGNNLPADDVAFNTFKKIQLSKIDSLRNHGQLLAAKCLSRNLAATAPFNADKIFSDLDNQLRNSADYADELKRLLVNLQMEAGVRETYLQAFDSKGIQWWKNELEKMNRQIQTASDPLEQDACKRIKGFWGIACYSLCNRAISNNDFTSLQKYMSIYRLLEPQNPDMLRFSRLLGQ